jgi:hypothetical protein
MLMGSPRVVFVSRSAATGSTAESREASESSPASSIRAWRRSDEPIRERFL